MSTLRTIFTSGWRWFLDLVTDEVTETNSPSRNTWVTAVDKALQDNPVARACLKNWPEFDDIYLALLKDGPDTQRQHGRAGQVFFQKHFPMNHDGTLVELFRRKARLNLTELCKKWLGRSDDDLKNLDNFAKENLLLVHFLGPELVACRAQVHGLCKLAEEALIAKAEAGEAGNLHLLQEKHAEAIRLRDEALEVVMKIRKDTLDRFKKEAKTDLMKITTLNQIWNGGSITGESQPGCLTPINRLQTYLENGAVPERTQPPATPTPVTTTKGNVHSGARSKSVMGY